MGNKFTYEDVAEETGWSIEDIKRGYAFFITDYDPKRKVVQKIDDLDQYGLGKFETDVEAGKQALKDGYDVYLATNNDPLEGWYVLKE